MFLTIASGCVGGRCDGVREREQKKEREREADEKRNFGIFFTSSFLFPAKTEKKIARNLPRSTRPVERTKKPKVIHQ